MDTSHTRDNRLTGLKCVQSVEMKRKLKTELDYAKQSVYDVSRAHVIHIGLRSKYYKLYVGLCILLLLLLYGCKTGMNN